MSLYQLPDDIHRVGPLDRSNGIHVDLGVFFLLHPNGYVSPDI